MNSINQTYKKIEEAEAEAYGASALTGTYIRRKIYMKDNQYAGIIQKVIGRMYDLKTVYETDVHAGTNYMELWEWPQGVGLFGLYLYYKETVNGSILI